HPGPSARPDQTHGRPPGGAHPGDRPHRGPGAGVLVSRGPGGSAVARLAYCRWVMSTRRPPRAAVNGPGVALVSAAHLAGDIYQGVIPAMLPFLVAERHYSYAAISGITLAATVLSSVAQPVFGIWTDRRPRRWMIGTGMTVAAVGAALAGVMPGYVLTWIVVA